MIRYATLTSAKRLVSDIQPFLSFLKAKGIFLENSRNSIVTSFISSLEGRSELTSSQKNNMLRAVSTVVRICSEYNLLQGDGVIDCTFRFGEKRQVKRAPDKRKIHALDTVFFDLQQQIPNDYRCIYLLLRLIPNRISEVLSMDINCISYPEPDVYAISIPTFKENPYHIPIYKTYHRKLSGWCEGILYSTLRKQQIDVRSRSFIENTCQNYLFVHAGGKRLISTSDVNDYLKKTSQITAF